MDLTARSLTRRSLLRDGALAAGATWFGAAFWERAVRTAAAATTAGVGPYGPLQPPDANGIMLPSGFRSRVVARSMQPVEGTGYVFPLFPDGATTFPLPDGGWVLTVNSEVPSDQGGVSALRFARDGRVTGAQRILGGTSTNCAGGPTPWGTWLSCEEVDDGLVFECDPMGSRAAVVRPALGVFKHEAACVDPVGERVYLTEDLDDGCLYRFTPDAYPSLAAGVLEAAVVARDGRVTWERIGDPSARSAPTRRQVPGATRFRRGEGIWFDDGVVYVATTNDDTIHAYETATQRHSILYRRADVAGSPLQGVDNLVVSRSGDLFVCEDSYDNDPDALDVCMITREGEVARFAKVTGGQHRLPEDAESEITGVTFDPSGTRMYFASQRAAPFGGILYEVSGPFRADRPAGTRPGGRMRPGTRSEAPRGRVGAAIGIAVARRAGARRVAAQGLPIALTLAEPATVTATLRARATVGGRRRTIVLGRERRALDAGPETLRLRIDRADRALLRRRRQSVRAVLEVRVGDAVTRRPVALVARR